MYHQAETSMETAAAGVTPCLATGGGCIDRKKKRHESKDARESTVGCALLFSGGKRELSEGGPCAFAKLIGPFRVESSEGVDVTPKGLLRRALLAVLLLSPGQSRSRSFLIDMFWGASTPAKSAASLRTALSELRKELRVLGEDCIEADRYSVRLRPGAISRDPEDGQQDGHVDFLEGMDLNLKGAEGFEDWLRGMRLSDPIDPPEIADPQASDTSDAMSPGFFFDGAQPATLAIALLPCRFSGLADPIAESVVNAFVDQISDLMTQTFPLRVYDYRDRIAGEQRHDRKVIEGTGARIHLQPALSIDKKTLHLRLLEARDRQVVWHSDLSFSAISSIEDEHSEQLRIFESLAAFVSRQSAAGEEDLVSPYQALVSMFRLDTESLDHLQELIDSAIASEARPVHHALNCYLATVRAGENLGRDRLQTLEKLLSDARLAVVDGDFYPYSLSMTGYALAFVAGELDLGADFAQRAVEIAPKHAFCWDQYALCLLHLGLYDRAADAVRKAQILGAHSPLRYTYDTSAAMISFARGDYQSSLRYGNRALFRMPRFLPALRYTASSMAHLGNHADSQRFTKQIRMIELRGGGARKSGASTLRMPEDLSRRLKAGLSPEKP